jgi:hypothetical protein
MLMPVDQCHCHCHCYCQCHCVIPSLLLSTSHVLYQINILPPPPPHHHHDLYQPRRKVSVAYDVFSPLPTRERSHLPLPFTVIHRPLFTQPQPSLKALMDAVAQISSSSGGVVPSVPFPFPSLHAATALGFATTTNINMAQQQGGGPLRKRDHESTLSSSSSSSSAKGAAATAGAKKAKTSSTHEEESKRTKRLEQNRTAAIESRRRKKHMVEELQRSVQYFSRANSALKSQNADLERQLLFAKHKISNGSTTSTGNHAAASTSTTSTKMHNNSDDIGATQQQQQEQQLLASSNVVPSSFLPSAPPNRELEEQARQAQFAATQALYKSMGYPAGAARIAASTFSQFVGQTGIAPGLSTGIATTTTTTTSSSSRESARPTKRNSATSRTTSISSSLPQAAITTSSPLIPTAAETNYNNKLLLPSKVESEIGSSSGDAYIDALNQFAMQQAAAANAAAAAATAAIQAVNIHNQLKQNGGGAFPTSTSSSTSTSSPSAESTSFPFPIPNTDMTSWPFQNAAAASASPFSKKE